MASDPGFAIRKHASSKYRCAPQLDRASETGQDTRVCGNAYAIPASAALLPPLHTRSADTIPVRSCSIDQPRPCAHHCCPPPFLPLPLVYVVVVVHNDCVDLFRCFDQTDAGKRRSSATANAKMPKTARAAKQKGSTVLGQPLVEARSLAPKSKLDPLSLIGLVRCGLAISSAHATLFN